MLYMCCLLYTSLDSDTARSEACTRLAQSIPGEIAVIRLVPARKDWNDVLRQQGDIPKMCIRDSYLSSRYTTTNDDMDSFLANAEDTAEKHGVHIFSTF